MTEIINRYANWPDWPEGRTAVIAEVGINHGGDEDLAWEMIKSAHLNGADFVKLQTYITEEFFHPSLSYFDSTKSMELSVDSQRDLFRKAKSEGIKLITTPFDFTSVDMVREFDLPAYKIASMDNDNVPLMRYIAEEKKPVMVSTGMAHMEEIQKVVDVFTEAGNEKLVLLHCVSDYPTKPVDVNLSMMQLYMETFNCPTGLSDHSLGIASALAAVSLGATVIEKHFTTDKALFEKIPDADHDISIEPFELKELRDFCEMLPAMMGVAPRTLTEGEKARRRDSRRGLYAVRDIQKGEKVCTENVILLRPVNGIHAGRWDEVCGREMIKRIKKGQPITDTDLGL